MPEEALTEELRQEGWFEVFSQLLGGEYRFQLVDDGEYVSIQCESAEGLEAVRQRLDDLFLFPGLIQRQLRYQLGEQLPQDGVETTETQDTVLRSRWETPDSPEAGAVKQIVEQVLSNFDMGDGVTLSLPGLLKGAEVGDSPILFSRPLTSSALTLWQESLPRMLEQLANISLLDLRAKYLGMDEAQPGLAMQQTLSRSLWEKFLYFKETEQGTRLVFDAYVFHAMLFPPKFAVNPDAAHTLSVAKKHFITSLTQALPEGVMLTDPTEQEPSVRHPVLLPSTFSQGLNTKMYLMLDVTGSMRGFEEDYKQKVQDYIDRLRPYFRSDEDALYIIPFSEAEIPQEFPAFHLRTDQGIANAMRFVSDAIRCDGQTRLYGAVADLLDRPTFTAQELDNRVIVLLTDGEDNIDTDSMRHKMEDLFGKMPKDKLFQSFIMGLGGRYSEKLCEQIAQGTGGTHIKIDSIADFNKIYENLGSLSQLRVLRQIVGRLISVYDTPRVMRDIPLTEGEPFDMGGRQVRFVNGALRAVSYLPVPEEPLMQTAPQGDRGPLGYLPSAIGYLTSRPGLLAWVTQSMVGGWLQNSSLLASPQRYLGLFWSAGVRATASNSSLSEEPSSPAIEM